MALRWLSWSYFTKQRVEVNPKGLGGLTRYKRLLEQFFSLGFILIFVEVLSASGVKFRLNIDNLYAFPGSTVELGINSVVKAVDSNLINGQAIGGFSFLISYDKDYLSFREAQGGQLLTEQNWEFFTYRHFFSSSCSSGCAQPLIRLLAYADINNGNSYTNWSRQNTGQLAVLKFKIQDTPIITGLPLPVSWYWKNCNDNVIFDSSGGTKWVVDSLYDFIGNPVDLSSGFLTNVSNCDTLSGANAKRFAVFSNGSIIALGEDGIDDRGDLNLNGSHFDIADYVLFDSYFLYGGSVFSNNPTFRQSQVAASDVNRDGIPLQVSDLVLMLKIIIDEDVSTQKIVSTPSNVELSWACNGSRLQVTIINPVPLGGLFLLFRYSGEKAAMAEPVQAYGMKQRVNVQDGELRILLNPEGADGNLPAGQNTFTLNIDGIVELIEAQASSVDGRGLVVSGRSTAIPTGFSLSQNVPNPFNPSTSFTLSLPKASRYIVKIYNLAGQVVKNFEGEAGAGNRTIVWDGTDENGVPVSSGIYFYKAQTEKFSQTKKMFLIR